MLHQMEVNFYKHTKEQDKSLFNSNYFQYFKFISYFYLDKRYLFNLFKFLLNDFFYMKHNFLENSNINYY